MRESNTYTNFKYQINKNIRKSPKYYMIGIRFAQIQHTRLRTSCSSLNHHLFSKNIVNDPHCLCGTFETTKHYLFECQRFSAARTEMINKISRYCMPSLNSLLFGDDHLNNNSNSEMFLAVQKFIIDSKRFQSWGISLSHCFHIRHMYMYYFHLTHVCLLV